MSISKSSSSVPASEVKLLKTNFEKREAELENVHNQEIKRLAKQHEIEITQVNERAKKEIDETRDRSRTKLTEQDLKHQQEIQSIKALYQKKLNEKEG